MITKPYSILHIQRQRVLLCLVCDRYSGNPNDIAALYCGYCHTWLTTLRDDFQRPDEELLPPSRPAERGTL